MMMEISFNPDRRSGVIKHARTVGRRGNESILFVYMKGEIERQRNRRMREKLDGASVVYFSPTGFSPADTSAAVVTTAAASYS